MTQILYTDYSAAKAAAISALTETGKSFSWTQVVVQGVTDITVAQIEEIQNAIDLAYDAINTGCSSNCSTHNSSKDATVQSANRQPNNSSTNKIHDLTYNSAHYGTNNSSEGVSRSSNRGMEKVKCGREI